MRMKKDIRAYEYEELQKELERLGEKPFRAKQIYEWLHVKLADRFDEMTNLSVKLREKLAEEYDIFPVQMAERRIHIPCGIPPARKYIQNYRAYTA